jgi:mono/diheme cytochrome c family protein
MLDHLDDLNIRENVLKQQDKEMIAPKALGSLAFFPFWRLFFWLLGAFSFFLFCCESGPPPGMTDPGELIYFGYVNKQAQCSRCHGDEGQGGMFGPKIHDAMQRLGADSVRAIIQNGKGEGDRRMPGLADELTPEQIEQVIAFLRTWGDTVRIDSLAVKTEK